MPGVAVIDTSNIVDVPAYGITTSYTTDMGVRGIGVMDVPGTPPDIIMLRAPTCTKVVDWTATVVGSAPALPSPDTRSTNEILIKKEVRVSLAGGLSDDTPVYTVSGSYAYLLLQPPSDDDVLSMGANPYLSPQPPSNLSASCFQSGIIDASPVQANLVMFPFDQSGNLTAGNQPVQNVAS